MADRSTWFYFPLDHKTGPPSLTHRWFGIGLNIFNFPTTNWLLTAHDRDYRPIYQRVGLVLGTPRGGGPTKNMIGISERYLRRRTWTCDEPMAKRFHRFLPRKAHTHPLPSAPINTRTSISLFLSFTLPSFFSTFLVSLDFLLDSLVNCLVAEKIVGKLEEAFVIMIKLLD